MSDGLMLVNNDTSGYRLQIQRAPLFFIWHRVLAYTRDLDRVPRAG